MDGCEKELKPDIMSYTMQKGRELWQDQLFSIEGDKRAALIPQPIAVVTVYVVLAWAITGREQGDKTNFAI